MNEKKKNVHEGLNIQKENFCLDCYLAHQVPTCNIMKHFRQKILKIQIPNRKAISDLTISKQEKIPLLDNDRLATLSLHI